MSPDPTTARSGGGSVPGHDPDTPVRLRMIIGKLSRRLAKADRGSGLTPAQLSALGVVARHEDIRLADLAEIEGLNPTMLSRIVAVLEEQGLLRRRVDPDDRRAGVVEVTANGRRTYERLRAKRGKILAEGLESLTPGELAAVESALPALEALVEAVRASRHG